MNGGNPTVIQAGLFDTAAADNSVPVIFANAWLTTGVVNPDTTATIDLDNPLRTSMTFLAQDTDFAPFYVAEPKDLSETIRAGIADGTIRIANAILVRSTDYYTFRSINLISTKQASERSFAFHRFPDVAMNCPTVTSNGRQKI